jgi:hypothetical protein
MPGNTTPASTTGVKMTYAIGQEDDQIFEFSPVPFIQCDTAFDLSGKETTGQTITINVTGTLVAGKPAYYEYSFHEVRVQNFRRASDRGIACVSLLSSRDRHRRFRRRSRRL